MGRRSKPSSSRLSRIVPIASVHHVRRRDHVGTSPRVRQCLFREEVQRGIVVHIAVDDDAAMAVVGVLAQADVSNEQQIGHAFLDGTHRLRDDPGVTVSARAHTVFLLGNTEQDHGGNPEVVDALAFFDRTVHRELYDARHAGDGLTDPRARDDEQRHDQVVDAQPRLTDHAAEVLVLAQPARSILGELHGSPPPVGLIPTCGPTARSTARSHRPRPARYTPAAGR